MAAYDLIWEKLEDEVLVVMAEDVDNQEARERLVHRYLPWLRGRVRWFLRKRRFRWLDQDDLEQEAAANLLKAMKDYDTNELARPDGRRFRSFLCRRLDSRFIDLTRHERRATQRQEDRVIGMAPSVESSNGAEHVNSELVTLLFRAVESLDPPARQLWDLQMKGMSLRSISPILKLSYDGVKRLRRRSLYALTQRLRDDARTGRVP